MSRTHRIRTIRCHELIGPSGLRLDEVDCPPPGIGEVRLAMKACGINFPDLLMTQGKYQFRPDLPFSPGMEVAGVVIDCGHDVRAFSPGDRVLARTMSHYPGLAEEIVIPQEMLLPIPDSVDDLSAATLFLTYYTAYNALVDKAHLAPGETLLIHGAAGGVGLAAVQIGLALGARVLAVAGSPEKLDHLRREGVHEALDHRDGDLRARLKALTGNGGVDVVLDPVGGSLFDTALRVLAPAGRLLVVGFTSGEIGVVPANIALIKEISVIGVRAGEYALRHPDALREAFATLVGWFEAGRIAPRVARTFPLERAAEALESLEDRTVIGKVAVQPH